MGGVLIRPIILTVFIYFFLKFIVPNLPHSAPLPSSLIFLYLMLTTAGIVIFATLSGASKDAFFGPIFRFLTGEGGGASAMRAIWCWRCSLCSSDGKPMGARRLVTRLRREPHHSSRSSW